MTKFDFGAWLKAKRTEKELLAEDVAKKAGLTPVSISRYETGKRLPNIKTAMDICKALGLDSVKPEDFEFLTNDEEELTEDSNE